MSLAGIRIAGTVEGETDAPNFLFAITAWAEMPPGLLRNASIKKVL